MRYLNSRVAVVVIMLFGIGSIAEARILYVDQNDPAAFQIIQDAVDFASNGDTIVIKKGRYAGAIVDKAVHIRGNKNAIIDIGIEVDSFPYGTRGFRVNADGVTISHLSIEGVGIGIDARGIPEDSVDDVSISHVTIRDGTPTYRSNGSIVGSFGVYSYRGNGWIITQNDIGFSDDHPGYGIYIVRGMDNLVTMNDIKHEEQMVGNKYYFGAVLLRAEFNKIVHNKILIDAEKRACVYVGHSTSMYNTIGFNDFRGSTVDAFLFAGASADDNLIAGNLGDNRNSMSYEDASGFRPIIKHD